MCTTVLQQLLNILQAANVAAIKADQNCDKSCRLLIDSLFLANGATFDGSPSDPPDIFVGDFLVFYDAHGLQAYLTRAQAAVIDGFFGDCDDDDGNGAQAGVIKPATVSPVGCCSDANGMNGKDNVPRSMCNDPQVWHQRPCASPLDET
jgi:hypothetical protein